MQNPFLMHPTVLQTAWKDLRRSVVSATTLTEKLKIVSDFWKHAPTSKPYLDYLAPQTWPDAWTLLDSRLLDNNSISLGMFYTLLLCESREFNADRIRLAMIRQPSYAWEGLVCIIDDQWVIGYDRDRVCELASIPAMLVMHTYKYDLQKRCVKELLTDNTAMQTA